MNGQYLVKTRVQSPVTSYSKPTNTAAPADKTIRSVELEKGMNQPLTMRENAPSITLGSM